MPVFDFSEKKEEKKAAVITYEEYVSDKDVASVSNPIMVLSDNDKKLIHHQKGVFGDINKRSTFECESEDGKLNVDIIRIDSRFVKFLEWISEKRIRVKLSGKHSELGYCIYRIHAINMQDEIKNDTDSFLQYIIGRLLTSQFFEEDNIEDDEDDEEMENEDLILSDMSSMTDFIFLAGNLLPKNMKMKKDMQKERFPLCLI